MYGLPYSLLTINKQNCSFENVAPKITYKRFIGNKTDCDKKVVLLVSILLG